MSFKGKSKAQEKLEIPMAPMIDVVFLLLIFFMVSASFKIMESEIGVNLPVAAAVEQDAKIPDEVIIDVLSDGAIFVNEQEYDSSESKDLLQLRTMLSRLREIFKDQAVIIRGQEEVPHGRVVDVLNTCAAAEIERISFFAPE